MLARASEARLQASTDTSVGNGALAWYSLSVLIAAVIFGFIDRQILVLVVEPIKRDLGLSDLQIGAIQGLGPALFAALAGYPLAWLADRMDRRWLLILCILFWSAATAARGLAGGFGSLLAFTTGIAVGEAVLTPVVYSLIPDLFLGKRRELANFIFFGMLIIGVGLGMMLGGVAVASAEALRPLLPSGMQAMAGWRLVFFLVAAPGVIISILVLPISARRRVPSVTSSARPQPASLWSYLRSHKAAVVPIMTAAGFYAFGLGVIATWLPIAIIRVLGASAAEAGVQFGFAFIVASGGGIMLAMATASFWRRVAGRGRIIRAMWVSMALAVPPLALLPWAGSPQQAYVLAGLALLVMIGGTAFSPTMLQDMAPPLLRARVAALVGIIYAVFGAAGPMAAGFLSDAMAAAPGGLLSIIALLAAVSLAAAAALYRLAERPFIRTLDALDVVD